MVDVSAAKASRTKKTKLQNQPAGSCAKTFGKVMNTSSGPAVGAIPKLNTAGKIITPARMATTVSNVAT